MIFLQHQSHLPSEIMFAGIRFSVFLFCFLNKSNLKLMKMWFCSSKSKEETFQVSASASRPSRWSTLVAFMRRAEHSGDHEFFQEPGCHTSLESQSTSQPTRRTRYHHSHVICRVLNSQHPSTQLGPILQLPQWVLVGNGGRRTAGLYWFLEIPGLALCL